jgi:hypothetical protein
MLAALGGGSFAAHAHQVAFQNELSGRGGARQILQEGLIGLRSGGERTLVLATEPALLAKKDVQVRQACTGPL